MFIFFHALQTRLQNRKVLVVADRLYYIDRCVLQYFGVMDYVLKTRTILRAIRSDREKLRLRKPGCVSPQATKENRGCYVCFNAGETPGRGIV